MFSKKALVPALVALLCVGMMETSEAKPNLRNYNNADWLQQFIQGKPILTVLVPVEALSALLTLFVSTFAVDDADILQTEVQLAATTSLLANGS